MIKGIKLFFTEIINNHGIRVEKEMSSRRTLIAIGTMKGRRIILKLRKSRRYNSRRNYETESSICKILDSNNFANKNFQSREVIDYSLKYPQWIIFEYKEGIKSSCEYYTHWCLSKKFYKINTPQKFFKVLSFWYKDITFFVKNSKATLPYKFKKYNFPLIYTDFINASNFYLKKHLKKYKVKQIYFKEDKSNIGDILKNFRKTIEENNKYLCHGDMNPNNILTYKGKTIVLDLETTHFDLPYSDLIFIWFASWNNLKWRNDLFNLFLKDARDKELFKTLFYLSILRFLPKVLGNITAQGDNDKKLGEVLSIIHNDYEKAINYLSKIKS